jgi:ribosomal protein S8
MGFDGTFVHSLLSQLKLAYRKNHVCVTLRLTHNSQNHVSFLRCLRVWGLISHYEVGASTFACSSISTRSQRVRIFLRYRDGQPSVCFWSFGSSCKSGHVVTYDHLHRLAWYQPGVTFILRTGVGLLSLQDCLARRLGGCLFMALRLA